MGGVRHLPERVYVATDAYGEGLSVRREPLPPGPRLLGEESEYVRAGPYREAVDRVAQLETERQMVLDAVNLYGDETLHKALDALGWPATGGGR